MELWNDIIIEKSQNILFELKNNIGFILIGGWASWLYAKTARSKDIDLYIDFKEFFKLQNFLMDKGFSVNFNQRLNKYESKTGEIDIDIYTPDHCNLRIPCKDVFNKRLWKEIGGFKVISPEVLILLKLNSEENRRETIKGFKDRIDILSILSKTRINKGILIKLSKEYNLDLNNLRGIIKKSNKEYSYLFKEAENLRKLKKFKLELLKNV